MVNLRDLAKNGAGLGKRRRKYSSEMKLEVVRKFLVDGDAPIDLAEEYNIPLYYVYRWTYNIRDGTGFARNLSEEDLKLA